MSTEIAEEEIIDKDGRSIRCFSSQIRDENNIYFGRLYLFEDITERKRAENALWENQRFLSTLIGNLPGMVYRCYIDRTGRWITSAKAALTSPATCRMKW